MPGLIMFVFYRDSIALLKYHINPFKSQRNVTIYIPLFLQKSGFSLATSSPKNIAEGL